MVHVITWEYSDKSSNGLIGAWDSYTDAKDIFNILVAHSDKTFRLFEVEGSTVEQCDGPE